MDLATVHAKSVLLLLLIHVQCLLLFSLLVGFCSNFDMQYLVSFLFFESWLFDCYCLSDVFLLLLLCDSSSRCRGLVCSV